MYLITGSTGRTGSQIVKNLLKNNQSVTALIRSEKNKNVWQNEGIKFQVSDFLDRENLINAFCDVKGVFLMIPTLAESNNIIRERALIIENFVSAIIENNIKNVVVLSSIGAHLETGTGQVSGLYELENKLRNKGINIKSLRCSLFIENWLPFIKKSISSNQLDSFINPLNLLIDHVCTSDIALCATEYLLNNNEHDINVAVKGPEKLSANIIANYLSDINNIPINSNTIPKEKWAEIWKSMNWSDERINLYTEFFECINQSKLIYDGSEIDWFGKVNMTQYIKTIQ